jgi:hypothetical protein
MCASQPRAASPSPFSLKNHSSFLSISAQAAAGRISIVAAAGINAACAADVVAALASPSCSMPVTRADDNARTVWLHMSGSALEPTGADPELQYVPPSMTTARVGVLQLPFGCDVMLCPAADAAEE